MPRLLAISLIAACLIPATFAASPFAGRWDVTVKSAEGTYPDWMELTEKGGAPQVRLQPRTGSVHPVKVLSAEGNRLTLQLSAANTKRQATTWELTAANGKISGTEKHGEEAFAQLAGVRAPELKRDPPKAWTNPEPLFNGKDLTGWVADEPAKNHWEAQSGVLVNVDHGANLQTTRKFDDFKLHIELNCPDGGNSGIYLRGRYEIQVAYEKAPDSFHSMGSIYGMIAPSVELPRKPGEWETLDVTLVGRWVTIVRNGTTVINNQEIAGFTGGALDPNESEPGPFYIQGDHTGGMKYRNITIQVPKK
jgi:hypothetical protein